MCGIVGYCGRQSAAPIVIDGLRRLEYRGYDSAGVAFHAGKRLAVTRRVGKLANLAAAVQGQPNPATLGIGHTRWATHGRPTASNAHPHTDHSGSVAVVHNGIIDNYRSLQLELAADGVEFASQTDTEVIAHLVARELANEPDLLAAVRSVTPRLSGSFAIVVIWSGAPGLMVAARQASPLSIGVGEGENLVASDIPALIPYTRKVMHLENGDVAAISADQVEIFGACGHALRPINTVAWGPALAEKGTYRHFMQKEIFEQPRALADTLQGRIQPGGPSVDLGDTPLLAKCAKSLRRVMLLACGTSLHAAMLGQTYLEQIAGIPTEIENAAEFEHRAPKPGVDTLVVVISQSGETFDTIQAAIAATVAGAPSLAITNVVESTLARTTSEVIYTRAGPEIGVASTKTFTATISLLYLLAVAIARWRDAIGDAKSIQLLEDVARIPQQTDSLLAVDRKVERLAHRLAAVENVFFVGRGPLKPIALEGALKLKELSYIHAEGYPAGELKHGPIALITKDLPTVVIAPPGESRSRMLSCLEEIKSRDGKVLAIGAIDDGELADRSDWFLAMPKIPNLLAPICYVVPLQLLAYHIAVRRGCDVDQPRNLAKTVTVE